MKMKMELMKGGALGRDNFGHVKGVKWCGKSEIVLYYYYNS